MTAHDIKNFAVKTIREELTAKQVVLFGSNARQNALPDSDWDFLVCIEEAWPWVVMNLKYR